MRSDYSTACRLLGTCHDYRWNLRRARGVTLIECLIVLAMLAVLLGLAMPSMTAQYASWQIRSHAAQLMSAAMTARGLAMSSGEVVTLCPMPEASAVCSGHYGQGFAVVREDGSLYRWYPGRAGVSVRNRAGDRPQNQSLTWDAKGIGSRNLTLSVCSVRSQENRALVVNRVGRPRRVRDWGRCDV